MKVRLLIGILALLSIAVSCRDDSSKTQEEVSVVTLTGKIAFIPMPPTTTPPLPGLLFCLSNDSGDYILTLDGLSFVAKGDTFTVANVDYSIDDEVEITGTVTETERSSSEKDIYVEIKTIKKDSS